MTPKMSENAVPTSPVVNGNVDWKPDGGAAQIWHDREGNVLLDLRDADGDLVAEVGLPGSSPFQLALRLLDVAMTGHGSMWQPDDDDLPALRAIAQLVEPDGANGFPATVDEWLHQADEAFNAWVAEEDAKARAKLDELRAAHGGGLPIPTGMRAEDFEHLTPAAKVALIGLMAAT
jgi:hypothetical protein